MAPGTAGKRVLHILCALDAGGVEVMLTRCLHAVNRGRVHFDFLIHSPREGALEPHLRGMGCQIFRVPSVRRNPFGHLAGLSRVLREGGYDSVVAHKELMSVPALWLARRYGVPVRIAHCHNAGGTQGPLCTLLCRIALPRLATGLCACSREAGSWLFGRRRAARTMRVYDAFSPEAFRFDSRRRAEQRARLGLGGRLVLGHVGRFSPQKNQRFLFDILEEVRRREPSAVLLLIGRGELLEELRAEARRRGLSGAVRFFGVRGDVDALLQAMDVFLFPSLYEGLGIALVEAQAAGLPCLASSRVPREADVTGLVRFLPPRLPAEAWAEAALALRGAGRPDTCSRVAAAGYEMAAQAARLEAFYLGEAAE